MPREGEGHPVHRGLSVQSLLTHRPPSRTMTLSLSEIRGRANPRFFSFNREHCLTFHVFPAETEFREERDSHRSRAGGVTPACLGLLLQNGKPDDAPDPLAKQS
jgi:hypothetical protein